MKTWRRRTTALAIALLIVLTGCSSDDSGDEAPAPTEADTAGEADTGGDVGSSSDMDPSFDVSNLPDDFPTEALPSAFAAGMYAELGTVRSANFETTASFDEVIAELTAKIGEEPNVVQGEERLAQWMIGSWVVSVIESTPTLIGFATAE